MNPYIKICLKMFLYTRLFFIFIIIISYSSNLVSKYDLSTDLLSISEINEKSPNFIEKIISKFLSYFSSYDAIHYILIAKNDYFNDNIFAFFPLFPWLIRGLARMFELLFPFTSEFIPFMISGFIMSNFFCLINAILIFIQIYQLTNSFKKAKISTFLFLINPGSIFYISIYSENFYLLLELILIHFITKSGHEKFDELNLRSTYDLTESKPSYFFHIAGLLLGLLLTRSNSIALCTYFIIPSLLILLYKEKYIKSFVYFNFYNNLCQFFRLLNKVYREIGIYIILCFHALICFIYVTKIKPRGIICAYIKRGINKSLTKYNLFEDWCYDKENENGIKSFYSYIEKEYWNVGFLKQYSINTIDRIILSIPMNILGLYVLYKIYSYFNFGELLPEFNFGKFFMYKNLYQGKIYSKHEENGHFNEIKNIYKINVTTNAFIIGGGLNFLVNFLILVFIAHPQINNRILTACPILYLAICDDVIDFMENNKRGNYKRGFAILLFFGSFALLGCIMQVGAYGFA